MIEVGDSACFRQIGIGIFDGGDSITVRHFDGDKALQLVVISQINKAEATLAQHSFNSVATNV